MSQKIVDIHTPGKSLMAEYLENLAKQKNWDWEIQNEDHFNQEALRTAEAALVDPALSSLIIPKLTTLPTQVRSVGCLDSMFKDDGHWYPRLLFFEALRQVIVSKAPDVDIRSPGFVVGHSEMASAAVAVLTDMGYSEVYMTSEDDDKLKALIHIIRQSRIGVNIHSIAANELTMQSLSCSIVINTMAADQNKALQADLSYFNFMRSSGIVIDLNLLPLENTLLEESEKAGLRAIHPLEIMVKMTDAFLQRLGQTMKVEEIHESWKIFLQTFLQNFLKTK